MRKKVLVCLSGGIDSSLSAILLKEQGYDLVAATFRVYDSIQEGCLEKLKGCCSIESIAEAKHFAKSLGIEHYILDYREYFKQTVIQNFISDYFKGRTPNPCVLCNAEIKWGKVLDFAQSIGCDYIATGHYANVFFDNNRYILSKGKDTLKDQSYFLWMLTQENLSKTIFPLGKYTKEQVKQLAKAKNLNKLLIKKESQEICFIPNNNYREFLKNEIQNKQYTIETGNFITSEGKIVGKHKGIAFYTIGQRKGLGVALGEPYYVKEIRVQTNEIVLSKYEHLKARFFIVNKLNFISLAEVIDGTEVEVKVRYRTKAIKAKVYNVDINVVKVVPEENVYAVTPGQSAVFYNGNIVLFGGIIDKVYCND